MLGRHWEYGQATIVARLLVTEGTYRYHTAYEYAADVQPDSGAPPFRASFKESFYTGEYHEPDVGERARVKFRGKDPEVEFDRSELKAVLDAEAGARREQFDATAHGAPGSTAPPAAGPGDQPAAPLDESREILAAILRAKQADDLAEVERLKARMSRLAAQRQSPGQ